MISTTMIVWGTITALTALVHTPAQLYAARLVLGAAEAGFFLGGHCVPQPLVHAQADRAKATSNSHVCDSALFRRDWLTPRRFDPRPKLVFTPWLAVALHPGRNSGHRARHNCVFLPTDLPTEAKWLTAQQRDWLDSSLGRGAPDQYTGDAYSAGTNLPNYPRRGRSLRFQQLYVLQFTFLVALHDEAPDRIFRCPRRRSGRAALCGSLPS